MEKITINASTHSYNVEIGASIRFQLEGLMNKTYKKVLIITDHQVAPLYLEDVKQAFSSQTEVFEHIVPAGEASKSMEQYSSLLDTCITNKLDRKSLIVGLGGGMVGDLAGFAASTYLRGVDFLQMPTTILAHDSSVGGKVAINHSQGKNLIGCFYNPVQVIYDTETLLSLPPSEIRSGFGEVVKHALLSDPAWCTELLESEISAMNNEKLNLYLSKGIQVKADIVEKDEKEQGIRQHLNLGHTLAHALEAELGYGQITHGEAVAIGIWFALRVSEKQVDAALPTRKYRDWLINNDYPVKLAAEIDSDKIISRMKWDKKTVESQLHYVLLKSVGQPLVKSVEEDELKGYLTDFIKEVSQH
ncbi:3-dehydroquinate synthase [Halobacillus sp. A5]|uniref:3-dehydroquinate synthase n=1 Tax=Halobacillus sp. A5 TaxID=2880263 RepID=UPI0020A6769C|nr:3-dehydroquinate synthase [Halobacillus sp. A5]MCP3025859.1 3-dehydroquinate synthase [Halobacillus sp. A5]